VGQQAGAHYDITMGRILCYPSIMHVVSKPLRRLAWMGIITLAGAGAGAAVINVTTNDNYTKIESAQPGDQVMIAQCTG